jgi:hypothetical protein
MKVFFAPDTTERAIATSPDKARKAAGGHVEASNCPCRLGRAISSTQQASGARPTWRAIVGAPLFRASGNDRVVVKIVAGRTNGVMISAGAIVAEQRFQAVAGDHMAKVTIEWPQDSARMTASRFISASSSSSRDATSLVSR